MIHDGAAIFARSRESGPDANSTGLLDGVNLHERDLTHDSVNRSSLESASVATSLRPWTCAHATGDDADDAFA